MSMQKHWEDLDKGKRRYSEKTKWKCHFSHPNSAWTGIRCDRPTNSISGHGTAYRNNLKYHIAFHVSYKDLEEMQLHTYQDSCTQIKTIIFIKDIPQYSGYHIFCLQYVGCDENGVMWMYKCVADTNGCIKCQGTIHVFRARKLFCNLKPHLLIWLLLALRQTECWPFLIYAALHFMGVDCQTI